MRAWSPDTVTWMGGPLGSGTGQPYIDQIRGEKFPVNPGWTSWFRYIFEIVPDRPDLDGWNRWGGPYPGGGLFAMADGSVRSMSYSVDLYAWIDMLTPKGGEPGVVE